jgi:hypothetical protein
MALAPHGMGSNSALPLPAHALPGGPTLVDEEALDALHAVCPALGRLAEDCLHADPAQRPTASQLAAQLAGPVAVALQRRLEQPSAAPPAMRPSGQATHARGAEVTGRPSLTLGDVSVAAGAEGRGSQAGATGRRLGCVEASLGPKHALWGMHGHTPHEHIHKCMRLQLIVDVP